MTEALPLLAIITLYGLYRWHRERINKAYYKGRYDELIDSQPWKTTQRDLAYRAGRADIVSESQVMICEMSRQSFHDGRHHQANQLMHSIFQAMN